MSSVLEILFMIIHAIQFIMGILGNGFIVLVNTTDWIRSWKISLIDFILTCLAISRICLLCVIILFIYLNIHEKMLHCKTIVVVSFEILWIVSNYFCTVCTTCLSVFYFLKIANCSNPIVLWMKRRIHRVLIIFFLGFTLCFFICFLLKETLINKLLEDQVTMEGNLTCISIRNIHAFFISQILPGMVFFFLFVVSLAAFLLLIFSLWSHTRRMKLQGMCSREPGKEAHIRAIKLMISFLLLFVLYYLSSVLTAVTYGIPDNAVAKMFTNVLMFFYPSVHSFALISWNNKLKQASFCILRKLKCA
ncbi:taste receptor type 2 member 8-like [Dasypus novemcinctus]|uniref:taste receptor type 2 member 8-like n=1 Tax=Dasypus novemcinctus TaxID=9361 RepID=UPI00266045FB|nr:taste receptor type 2 member 8-like [Dasypus novemcinctus]